MIKLLSEALRHPKYLDSDTGYQVPLPTLTPDTLGTLEIYPSYRSMRIAPPQSQATALLFVVHANDVFPDRSLVVYGYKKHTSYGVSGSLPRYTYSDGIDFIEMAPTCYSSFTGAKIFILAVSDTLAYFKVCVFKDIESFSVFSLTQNELKTYRYTPIAPALPIESVPQTDTYITDDFEEANVVSDAWIADDFEGNGIDAWIADDFEGHQ